MTALGTLSELPSGYFSGLTAHNLVPLWPSLRKALPRGKPLANRSPRTPAFLFQVDDAPMQRKLGFFEVFDDKAERAAQ